MNGLLEQETLAREHQAEIGKALRGQWMLWALIASPCIVLFTLCHVPGERFPRKVMEPSALEMFRTIFVIIGAIELVLSFVLRWYLISPLFNYLRKYVFPSLLKGDRSPGKEQRGGRTEPLYLVKSRLKTIIPTGLASSAGLLGFVLYAQGDSVDVFCVFAVISLLGCLYHRPRRHEIVELCKEFLQDRQPSLSGEERSNYNADETS
jgi:hypothetical protein